MSSAGCLLPGGGTSKAGSREGGSPRPKPGAYRDSADVVGKTSDLELDEVEFNHGFTAY